MKQKNTAMLLSPEAGNVEKVNDEKARSKQALKIVKAAKEKPLVIMPPQPKGYIKPPRYDFF